MPQGESLTDGTCVPCGAGALPEASKSAAGEPIPYEVPVAGVGTGLRSELQAGEFSLVLDAGKGLGGQQSGPSPVQAFISAIVACTQITLQVVAKDKGVELPKIEWKGWGVFDARKLLSNTDTEPRFSQIKVHGRVETAATQAELDELAARTAERCPISQSLHPGVEYTVTLEKA